MIFFNICLFKSGRIYNWLRPLDKYVFWILCGSVGFCSSTEIATISRLGWFVLPWFWIVLAWWLGGPVDICVYIYVDLCMFVSPQTYIYIYMYTTYVYCYSQSIHARVLVSWVSLFNVPGMRFKTLWPKRAKLAHKVIVNLDQHIILPFKYLKLLLDTCSVLRRQ